MKTICSILILLFWEAMQIQVVAQEESNTLLERYDKIESRLSVIQNDSTYSDSTFYAPANPETDEAIMLYNCKDYIHSLPLLEKQAKTGDANARYYLARCYYYGQGTGRNYLAVVRLLKENDGITLADAQSCFLLSRCFRYGKGVSRDLEKADSLVIEAACMGLNDAIELLQIEKEKSREDICKWLMGVICERDVRFRLRLIEDLLKGGAKDSKPSFGLG